MTTARLLTVCILCLSACDSDYGITPSEEPVVTPQTAGISHMSGSKGPITDLDVLVVLDGSGSMSDDLESVGRGVVQLRRDIELRANEWSFTFITADPSKLGAVGPLGPEDGEIDLLMAPALLPITGAEKGFAAAYYFLHNNPEWMAPDRDLLIFLISDEDEQSSVDAELFNEWVNALKQGEQRADVVSIVSTQTSCSPDIGFKYADLAALRGNRVVDLCADNWVDWLSEFSFLTSYSPQYQNVPEL